MWIDKGNVEMREKRFIQDSVVDELRHRLTCHELYESLTNLDGLRIFMEHHVFAVWDFMSIVKSLQRDLTGITVPWIPPEDGAAARLINEIVLGEESDERLDGSFASHFHLYLEAMEEVGANTEKVERFLEAVASGQTVSTALDQVGTPGPARDFVNETFKVIGDASLHIRAAALFYGREELIPAMFRPMVEQLNRSGQPCGKFIYYLDRHIEVDSGEHSEWAEGLLVRLCGGDGKRKAEARQTAIRVLQSRTQFWDGIVDAVRAASSPDRAGSGSTRVKA